jgi:hypothetical protein
MRFGPNWKGCRWPEALSPRDPGSPGGLTRRSRSGDLIYLWPASTTTQTLKAADCVMGFCRCYTPLATLANVVKRQPAAVSGNHDCISCFTSARRSRFGLGGASAILTNWRFWLPWPASPPDRVRERIRPGRTPSRRTSTFETMATCSDSCRSYCALLRAPAAALHRCITVAKQQHLKSLPQLPFLRAARRQLRSTLMREAQMLVRSASRILVLVAVSAISILEKSMGRLEGDSSTFIT